MKRKWDNMEFQDAFRVYPSHPPTSGWESPNAIQENFPPSEATALESIGLCVSQVFQPQKGVSLVLCSNNSVEGLFLPRTGLAGS